MRKSDTKKMIHKLDRLILIVLYYCSFWRSFPVCSKSDLCFEFEKILKYNNKKNIRQFAYYFLIIKLWFFFSSDFYSLLMSLLPHKKGKYMRTLLGDPWNQIFCTSLNGKSFKTTYITYQTVIKKPFSSFTDDLLELRIVVKML